MKFKNVFIIGLIACVAILPALAQPKLTEPLPISSEIKTGTLPNGLKYYIKKKSAIKV